MNLQRVYIHSPNYSARTDGPVRLIVVHASEGAQTYQSLGNFFANPSSGVSSHVGIDDTPGVIGEYVKRQDKAWTAANANPVAVQAELCTPSGASANWSASTWSSHHVMLDNAARWVAEEAAYFGIPIRALAPSQAQGGIPGVCEHKDLGAWGGGHVDCGPNFPLSQVIDMALAYAAGTAPAPAPTQEDDMIIKEANGRVYQLIYDGERSYWRTLPEPAAKRVPAAMVIDDDGSLLSLWKVGAN